MNKIKISILLMCIFAMSFSYSPHPGQEAEIKLTVTIPQSITLEVLAGSQQVRDTQESEAVAVVTLDEANKACLIYMLSCVSRNCVVDLFIESEAQISPIRWFGSGCFLSEGVFDGSPQPLTSWMGPGQYDGKIMFEIGEGQELDLTFTLKTKEQQ